MTERDNAIDLLRRALKDPAANFRHRQWEAIDSLVNRRERLLVIQKTGWGKSFVYFIATRILRDRGWGPTLIFSPLLALMRNQIEIAKRLSVEALEINSANKEDWPKFCEMIKANKVDALLITPKLLANYEFVNTILLPIAETIGLVVVDEAHCISDQGHDCQEDYRQLLSVLQRTPDNIPILGTTATANDSVIEDIKTELVNINVQRGPLMRKSLELQNIRLPSKAARLAWLAEHINSLPGTGIIYTLRKLDAKQVADWLNKKGISAQAYYSGITENGLEESDSRQYLEELLRGNEIKVLVATADTLGIGFDKPDLGFVIHYKAPSSVAAYYQQVGRAGRSIDRAVGILLSSDEDEFFQKNHFPQKSHQRKTEWQQVQKYLYTKDCLMEFLCSSMDDLDSKPCGRCASCKRTHIVKPSFESETAINAERFLKTYYEKPLECNKKIPKGAFTIYPFNGDLPDHLRAETGRILSKWCDDGWGQIVNDDKYRERHFRNKLVTAVAEMITERWKPIPEPQWVTCVPSKKHPKLVPDYAERLAKKLRLPYAPVVKKVLDNKQQKNQLSCLYQCRNLDGAFAIESKVPEGPVLLVDDVVDSAWTLTVIAALLRQSGCRNVWPLALATSRKGA